MSIEVHIEMDDESICKAPKVQQYMHNDVCIYAQREIEIFCQEGFELPMLLLLLQLLFL